jgi:hypothetical protein
MDVFNAGLGNDDIIINASNITALEQTGAGNRARDQIIQAITVDIACTGDCVTTTITCHFTIDNKSPCWVVCISNITQINGTDDYSGSSVSSAGDINGDGLDDLIVGAYFADPSHKSSAGKSYVVFGKASAITLRSMALLSALPNTT